MKSNNRLQPCRISVRSAGILPANCADATNMGNVLDFTYSFDADPGAGVVNNGNVVSIANNRDTNRSQSFTYDELNRIKTAQSQASSGAHCWGLQFGYDIWANLLSAMVTKCSAPALNQSVGTNNRLSGYSYDAAGNMLSDGSFSYTWDAESRMKSGAGVTYTYDGDGRRVQKSNGKLYWYGPGLDALLEADLAGNNADEFVFFGGRRIARRLTSGTVNYYFADHLGSSRVVASSTGAVLDDSDFYAFGGERVVTSSSGNRYKFTGKERANLDYFIARYYSSQQGRFLSPDEFTGGPVDAFSSNDPLPPGPLPYALITNPQSLNKYSYTWNNPIRYIDPDGHWLETAWDVASLVVGAKSFLSNVRAGNYGAATLDALGVVADGVAVVAPVVPGGVGIALKAGRAANKLDNATDAAGAANKLDNATDAGQATTRYEPGADFSKKTKQEAREKADGTCEYCDEKTTPGQKSEKGVKRDKKEGTTDHYDPKSKGGTNDPRNAKHSCLGCNQNKGTKTPAQWEKERKPD